MSGRRERALVRLAGALQLVLGVEVEISIPSQQRDDTDEFDELIRDIRLL